MAEISTIARPYAEAIFSLALEESQLQQWSDMLQLSAMIATDADMQPIIGNTNVGKIDLADLFIDICSDKASEQGKNMIKLLVHNRRLDVLPEIALQYETLKAEEEKTIGAEVISAYELSAQQKKDIAAKLKVRLGREVSLVCRVDSSLLGGAIIKAGDMVIDGSTMGQIQKLAIEMAS